VSALVVTLTADELRALIRAGVDEAMAERDLAPASPAEPPREWLTARDAAQLMGCSTRYVSILAKRGELASSRLGRPLRFRRVDVVALLESRRDAA
jgi:excisionase family DNA binding protein